jgi:hypothetical protein
MPTHPVVISIIFIIPLNWHGTCPIAPGDLENHRPITGLIDGPSNQSDKFLAFEAMRMKKQLAIVSIASALAMGTSGFAMAAGPD